MTEGFDVGLEMSGNPAALHDMLANMAHGGRIAMLGIPTEEIAIDWNRVIFNMLTIRGIYGREMYETWYEMTVMLQSGLDISPVITHRFALRRLRGGLRGRGERRERQGRPRLGAVMFEGGARPVPGRARRDRRGRARQARARDRLGAGRARDARRRPRAAQPLRQQLPRPRQPSGRARGRARGARRARLRHGLGALHLRHAGHPPRARGAHQRVPRHARTRSSTRSCFDANAGLFETLLGEDDAIISDALNHASIIDGVRLCKARRLRYANGDMDELEQRLREAADARRRLIATDGVFSMDGHIAPLPRICELAEQYGAMVMVDDSHAVGFIGPGRPRHARAARRRRARRPRHRHARQGARRRQRRLHERAGARRSSCCASARARISSPTASPRRSWPRASPCSTCSRRRARRCASACSATRRASARELGGARPRRRAGRAPDRAGDVRRRAPRERGRRAPARAAASTPSRSPTRSCRWARRASARSSRPRSPTTTSTGHRRVRRVARADGSAERGASSGRRAAPARARSRASGTLCSARSAYSGRLTRIDVRR